MLRVGALSHLWLQVWLLVGSTSAARRGPAWEDQPLRPDTDKPNGTSHVTFEPQDHLARNYSYANGNADLTMNNSQASVNTSVEQTQGFEVQHFSQVLCKGIILDYEGCIEKMASGGALTTCDSRSPHHAFKTICLTQLKDMDSSGIAQWNPITPTAEEKKAKVQGRLNQCTKFEKMYAQAVAEGNFVVHGSPGHSRTFLGQVRSFDYELFCAVVGDLNFGAYSTAGMNAKLPGDSVAPPQPK